MSMSLEEEIIDDGNANIDIKVNCEACFDTHSIWNGSNYENCPHCTKKDEDRVQSD